MFEYSRQWLGSLVSPRNPSEAFTDVSIKCCPDPVNPPGGSGWLGSSYTESRDNNDEEEEEAAAVTTVSLWFSADCDPYRTVAQVQLKGCSIVFRNRM